MHRCEEAKRLSLLRFELFKKIDKFLSLNFRNFLISPLEGEKKFLSELCELRNFREGYNLKYICRHSNADLPKQLRCIPLKRQGKISNGSLRLLAQHETVLEPSPAFVMLTGVRKRLLPLTKREGCDSVIINSLTDTVFSRFTSHFSRKRTAFTLAEVLITLGIIGIVACMTMPALIGNYQKKVTAEKLKKLYLNYENAIQLTEMQEEQSRDEWRFTTVEERRDFVYNKLIPNLNCQKVVDKLGNSYPRYSPICVLNDGGVIAFHEKVASDLKAFELFFIIDSNAFEQNKILWGKNGFYYRMSVLSRNTTLTWKRADLLKLCKDGVTAQKNSSSQKDFIDYESRNCIDLIRFDGWTIRDDYPW